MKIKKFFKFLFLLILIFLILSPVIIPPSSEGYITQEEYIAEFEIENGEFIYIDGYKTYYIDSKNDSEKTILIVHGFGGSATNWLSVMPSLVDAGYRVVAVDLKGFGLSQKKKEEDFSHKSQVEFLHSFTKILNLKNITIVGHSMGGNIAVMYVQEYPEEIQKLILVNAAVLEGENFDLMRSHALKILDFPIIREYARVFLKLAFNDERIMKMFNSSMYEGENVNVEEPMFINPILFEGWEYVVIKMSSALHENVLKKDLSEIKVPVAIIWGQEDTWTPISKGHYLQKKLGSADLEIMPGIGHLPMFENLELFTDALKKSLLVYTHSIW